MSARSNDVSNEEKDPREDFLILRDTSLSLQLATVNAKQQPESSYAPFIWLDNACYLFLSELARHTQNLSTNSDCSLMMIEDEKTARNQFARQRIIFQGKAKKLGRDDVIYAEGIQQFRQRFGDIMSVLEPLQDFHLFQIELLSGRYIKGFGQAFELTGTDLDQFKQVKPSK